MALDEGRLLFERALDGDVSENEVLEYLNGLGDEKLVKDMLRHVAVASVSRMSNMKVSSSVVDWVLSKCRGNKELLYGALALMLSTGSVSAYQIKKGDTLWRLSGGNVDSIISINPGLTKNTVLKPGMKIILPQESYDSYTVVRGDTFGGIAVKLGISMNKLKKMNPQIRNINRLSIGDKIFYRKDDAAVYNEKKESDAIAVKDNAVVDTDKSVSRGMPESHDDEPAVVKSDTVHGGGHDNAVVDEKADFVARVIYAETSTQCSDDEVRMVCQVIANRIGKRDFGKSNSAYDVVNAPNAFTCVSRHNMPWREYKTNLNEATMRDYAYAVRLMNGDRSFASGCDGIVYYHDKSIGTPSKWTNRYWKPVLVASTAHFKFYKIVPNR